MIAKVSSSETNCLSPCGKGFLMLVRESVVVVGAAAVVVARVVLRVVVVLVLVRVVRVVARAVERVVGRVVVRVVVGLVVRDSVMVVVGVEEVVVVVEAVVTC